MMANITGAAKGFAEKQFMEQSARLSAKIESKRMRIYEEYTSPEMTEHEINNAVINVIKTLNGMTISQAEAVLLQANGWLKATHSVDINSIEFLKFCKTKSVSTIDTTVERVVRRCAVCFNGGLYYSHALADYDGQTVCVKRKQGDGLDVFNLDGLFICLAEYVRQADEFSFPPILKD